MLFWSCLGTQHVLGGSRDTLHSRTGQDSVRDASVSTFILSGICDPSSVEAPAGDSLLPRNKGGR